MQTLKQSIIFSGLALFATSVLAGEPVFTAGEGEVAVEGYDVVAYFTRGEPMEGSPEHAIQWRGVEWRFASEAHLDRFRENPERYAPAYGGHCAFGVANGRKLASSPEYWVIHDGRLYLNLNEDVHGNWTEDLEENIEAADGNWPDRVD